MLTDPVADMLTRLRNANLALHESVGFKPVGVYPNIGF